MRGVRNVRGVAGRLIRGATTAESRDHQLFMQITVLEMEKARRGVERNAALRRMVEIDERMAQIAQERSELLAKLSERGSLALATEAPPEVALAAAGTGFRIRY